MSEPEVFVSVGVALLTALLGFLAGMKVERYRVGLDKRERDGDTLREILKKFEELDDSMAEAGAMKLDPDVRVFRGNVSLVLSRLEAVHKLAKYELRHPAHRKIRNQLLDFTSDPARWSAKALELLRCEIRQLTEP